MARNLESKKTKAKPEKVESDIQNFYASEPVVETPEPIIERTVPGQSANKKKVNLKLLAAIMGLILVGGLVSATVYFYRQYKAATKDSKEVSQEEAQDLVKTIGQFMELPQDETPKLATVTDKEKLKAQPFFARSENGDKVLMYLTAKKAILYRPSANRIIEVSTLAATSQPTDGKVAGASTDGRENKVEPTPPAVSETQPKTVRVVVLNGTSTKGFASELGKKISTVEGMSVIATGNAKGEFEKTVVVDLSGQNSPAAEKIAQLIGGSVGEFPAGEAKPDTDIVVIGGSK